MTFRPVSSKEIEKMSSQEGEAYRQRINDLPPQQYAIQSEAALLELRDGYIDEIPQHMAPRNTRYKCRSGWFQNIHCHAEILRKRNMLPDELVQKAISFQNELLPQLRKRLTRKEDIDQGNLLLTEILTHLKNTYTA